MKAEVKQMTRGMAELILAENKNNRNISPNRIETYVEEMHNGNWLVNGESIIIDREKNLRDGQHRLMAMLKADKFYEVVLVTDVEPDVMQTIDTGKGRTLKDVLEINKVKNATHIAAMIPKLYNYDKNKLQHNEPVTNPQGLQYYYKRPRPLHSLGNTAARIYARQVEKVIPRTEIALYHYMFSGFELTKEINDFLNLLCGIVVMEKKAPSYLYRKLHNAKINKIKYGLKYKLGMVIKAWNLFVDGNPDVMYFKYDSNLPMPRIERKAKKEKFEAIKKTENEKTITA